MNNTKSPFPKHQLPDPVIQHKKEENMRPKSASKTVKIYPRVKLTNELQPSLTTRGAKQPLEKQFEHPPPFKHPKKDKPPKPDSELVKRQREDEAYQKTLPDRLATKIVQLPVPLDAQKVDTVLRVPSPELLSSKVQPYRPSVVSMPYPSPQNADQLALRKPKSGIIVKTDDDGGTLVDQISLGYDRPYALDLIKQYGQLGTFVIPEEMNLAELQEVIKAMSLENEEIKMTSGKPGEGIETTTEQTQDQVSTEIKVIDIEEMRELEDIEEEEEDIIPPDSPFFIVSDDEEPPEMITRWAQRFRRESEVQKYEQKTIQFQRGTLQSHSFTNIKQKRVKEYKYGIRLGSYHQGDDHFSDRSRNKQSLGMAVAAYCFAFLKHPSVWNSQNIDDILEGGDQLYCETLNFLHYHSEAGEIKPLDLVTKLTIGGRKFLYRISEPLFVGRTRSDDRKIYNIYKAFTIFFNKYNCALFQTFGINLAVWKAKYFYLFDPTPRAKDLYPDTKGAASLISFYDITTIVSMLLERTKMGNWPFVLSKIDVLKNLDPAALDIPDSWTSGFHEANEYKILNDSRAVINASFSLSDPCFDFSCNKQALTMQVVALTYSKITPPAAWCRKIVDKILILGNQLFLEIVLSGDMETVELENIPAVFTLGPYKVELIILANVVKGTMFSRKKYPNIATGITLFFENSNLGILQFDKFSYGLWKERNYFYLFDPYPRDFEGFRSRDGTACFSMHNSINALVETLMMNVNKENNSPFSIHALKHLKIFVGGDELRPPPDEGGLDKKHSKKQIIVPKCICIDETAIAMERFAPNTIPNPSDIDIASNVDSLGEEYVPKMHHEHVMSSPAPVRLVSKLSLGICDLDSPSLSDTQILPSRPHPRTDIEGDLFSELSDDLFDYEMQQAAAADHGEGEGGGPVLLKFDFGGDDLTDFEKQMLEELNQFASYDEEEEEESIHEPEVERIRMHSVTTMTEGFMILKKKVLRPPKLPKSVYDKMFILERPTKHTIPETTQSEELRKDTNFINMPDGMQVVCGTINVGYHKEKVSLMTPFVVIMAIIVSRKYTILSWSSDILNYVIDAGMRLFKTTEYMFDELAVHEFERISLGSTDYSCKASYVLDSVFKQNIMEHTLKCLFKKCVSAIIVNPNYSCAVFMKNNLFYLFDPYANNKAGLGAGPKNIGNASLMRFTNLHTLITRILYNKSKRESETEYETTRYVLSIVETHMIPREGEPVPYKPKKRAKRIDDSGMDVIKEGVVEEDDGRLPKPVTLGYQQVDDEFLIRGTIGLKGRNTVVDDCVKECHFVCLCAMLMLFNYPIDKWDCKRIDTVLKQGSHIYNHAENKEIFERRTVNNILIENHFFDVLIKQLEFPLMGRNYSLKPMFAHFMTKRAFMLLQFPSCCMVYYVDDKHHLFNPYTMKKKKARWIRFGSRDALIAYLEANVRGYYYCTYYTFDITSIRKAPKKLALGHYISKYELDSWKYREGLGKPFYEKEEWLDIDPIPWSRLERKNAVGAMRGDVEVIWKEWDIEIPEDLWSLWGNLHQKSSKFSPQTRGKQTICNCVIAILMINVYEFPEWNPILMDNILKNGDNYFHKCIKDFKSEMEFEIDNLLPQANAFPFVGNISFEPCVEGTMFVVLSHQFNLYKAIYYFFDQRDSRYGIIICTNGSRKRIICFGKVREREYFMYDCESYGPPLFFERQGCSYVLKMNSFNRLIHCLTLTLREGDFYIFEIIVTDIEDNSEEIM